jgi:hypothetical protein
MNAKTMDALTAYLDVLEESMDQLRGELAELKARSTERGLTGEKGAPGERGVDGIDGKDGAPGRDGVDGKDGIDGKDGEPGPQGIDGKDGAPGINGKDGAPGPEGQKGVDGADGKDGAPGPQGQKGMDGAPGERGMDGRDGKDGRDGIATKDELLALVREQLAEVRKAVTADVVAAMADPSPRGLWKSGTADYRRGNFVQYDGSTWQCNVEGTKMQPSDGTNTDWTLVAKRGRDGRDRR